MRMLYCKAPHIVMDIIIHPDPCYGACHWLAVFHFTYTVALNPFKRSSMWPRRALRTNRVLHLNGLWSATE